MKLDEILKAIGNADIRVKVQDGVIVSVPEQEIDCLSKIKQIKHKITIKEAIQIGGEGG